MAVTLNKNSFCRIRRLPLFASKQTFARIDYLRQGERLVGKKALTMLNFRLKTRQNQVFHLHRHGQRTQKTRTLTFAKTSGYRACTKRHDDLNL